MLSHGLAVRRDGEDFKESGFSARLLQNSAQLGYIIEEQQGLLSMPPNRK